MNAVVTVFSKVLIPMFLVGMVGSLLVVGVTLFQDVRDVTKKPK